MLLHLDAAYNLARWIVRDPSLAEDVAQDALLRAWKYFESFRGDCSRGWLLQIVRNTAYTCIDGRRKLVEVSLDSEARMGEQGAAQTEIPDPRPGPEAVLSDRQGITALDQALNALPVALRECVILREVEMLSYKDIARITGVPIGTVMSRLSRARQMLRDELRLQTQRAPTPRADAKARKESVDLESAPVAKRRFRKAIPKSCSRVTENSPSVSACARP